MLKLLQRIVQEITNTKNLGEAFELLVSRIQSAIETQACSVFLYDPLKKSYLLVATRGLNQDAVGQLTIPKGEGLVGLIGDREEPLNLDNAPCHPNFLHAPTAEEDCYKSFLGVPIIHQRRLLGVLNVQREQSNRFDGSEEAFLLTLSAQIAGIIAHGETTGAISQLTNSEPEDNSKLIGVPSSTGVAIGTAIVVYPIADLKAVPDREPTDIKNEITSLKDAFLRAQKDITILRRRLGAHIPAEEQALFDAYLQILGSQSLQDEIIDEIQAGNWAQGALRSVMMRRIKQFEAMEDSYLAERSSDIRDLAQRILAHLQSKPEEQLDFPEDTILIGNDITASLMAELSDGPLAGIVSMQGSNNSHAAILARTLGVPAVMGAKGMSLNALDGQEVIVDGYSGQVHVAPSDDLRNHFITLIKEERELDASLLSIRDKSAETPDGKRVAFYVNAGLTVDASRSLSVGAEGVGLYRTEIPFMARDSFPTEEEQAVIYQQLLTAFAPRPVVMRTLDIGGDKLLPYFPIHEINPFLGWRGIRITLDHPEVFLVQVRAMMRANAGLNNLSILLPMITQPSEVDEALRLIHKAHEEINEEGVTTELPPIGVMIEVPAAVFQIRTLAKKVDFVSVGTNDLAQYLLAVDRNNARVANLYDPLHPAVLRSLVQVVEGVKHYGKPVSLCGEMAADPVALVLLVGMGFDALSMSSASLLRMKWVVRTFTRSYCEELLQDALAMDNPSKIRQHIEKAIVTKDLGGLIRAGKR